VSSWLPESGRWPSPFNTPLESGLRSLVLLLEAFPSGFDIQRLAQYDYLLVHSADVQGGPASLHPATPHRSGELIVRRPLVEQGIQMMMSRSLITTEYTPTGIIHSAGDWALVFINQLQSTYVAQLKDRAKWVVATFGGYSDERLRQFMQSNWTEWGAEFEFEAFVHSENDNDPTS
jgi:ABC-three component (ABC-3C) system Middle Component 2